MILLDTTVLAYAVGADHALRDPCRQVLAAHAEGRVTATTTIEVLQEFLHVRARRRPRSDAVALTAAYVDALSPIETTTDDLRRALGMFDESPALGAFDALLAAVAIGRGATLLSADGAFAGVPGLSWVDPAGAALERLLGNPSDEEPASG
jgi:hypothetical protein